MHRENNRINLLSLLRSVPDAVAFLKGGKIYPNIEGIVRFYSAYGRVIVVSEITGFPDTEDECRYNVFGFHIHSGSACLGDEKDEFANVGSHYNPKNCDHPYHSGDLPPIFNAGGIGFSAVLTSRFKVSEIIGKTIILHDSPDDFTTQPSGNSGTKIACGEIVATRR